MQLPPLREFARIAVVQTAYTGDVALALPLMEALRQLHRESWRAMVVLPSTAELAACAAAVDEVLVFDKRGSPSRGCRTALVCRTAPSAGRGAAAGTAPFGTLGAAGVDGSTALCSGDGPQCAAMAPSRSGPLPLGSARGGAEPVAAGALPGYGGAVALLRTGEG
jgi:hypothetical protein